MKKLRFFDKNARNAREGNYSERSAVLPASSSNASSAITSQIFPIWMMVLSSLFFSLMGVFVKLASVRYSFGELVFYRSLIGLFLMFCIACIQCGNFLSRHPSGHFWRSLSGAAALCLWFYSIEKLPLATAMTLNYTAPIWMVLFLISGVLLRGFGNINPFLIFSAALGFCGVVFILRPTMLNDQWWSGFVGLLSGFFSAVAFLQVAALGRVREPGYRVVFYFSLAGVILGAVMTIVQGGFSHHSYEGLILLLAMGVVAAVAQWSLTYALLNGKTLINASLQYLVIAFSSVFGWMIFGDRITPANLCGMVLIIAAGIIATNFRNAANH